MNNTTKIIITGVGGQGVIYLTELLCGAAMLANIPVATSEIHGLSQRGGSVTAGITFGENTFGFVETGGADFLLGLEFLETQRCVEYLHKNSVVVIDNVKIFPQSVNVRQAEYPDTDAFLSFLKKNIREVIFIRENVVNNDAVMRNIVVLGKAATLDDFPVKPDYIRQAIKENGKGNLQSQIDTFNKAL